MNINVRNENEWIAWFMQESNPAAPPPITPVSKTGVIVTLPDYQDDAPDQVDSEDYDGPVFTDESEIISAHEPKSQGAPFDWDDWGEAGGDQPMEPFDITAPWDEPTKSAPAKDAPFVLELDPEEKRRDIFFGWKKDDSPRGQAKAKLLSALGHYQHISKQTRLCSKERNRCKRRLMLAVRELDATGGDICDLRRAAGVQESQSYNLWTAWEFAERAKLLDKPADWEATHSGSFFDHPIPDFANMMSAEHAFSKHHKDDSRILALQERYLKMAMEGRLPSKRQIEREINGKNLIRIRLDCRERNDDPDVDETVLARCVLRGIYTSLRPLAKAGSARAAAMLKTLNEKMKDAVEARNRNQESPVEIDISGVISFAPTPTKTQVIKMKIREGLEQDRVAELARKKGDRWKPNGWYLNQLIADGSIKVPKREATRFGDF